MVHQNRINKLAPSLYSPCFLLFIDVLECDEIFHNFAMHCPNREHYIFDRIFLVYSETLVTIVSNSLFFAIVLDTNNNESHPSQSSIYRNYALAANFTYKLIVKFINNPTPLLTTTACYYRLGISYQVVYLFCGLGDRSYMRY